MTRTPESSLRASLVSAILGAAALACSPGPSAGTTPARSASPATLDDSFAALGRGETLPTLCFARSHQGRPACVIGSASMQGGVVRSIVLLHDERREFVYYQSAEGEQSLEIDASRIDHDALAAARAALDAGGFTPWMEGDEEQSLAPNAQVGVGALALVRTREALAEEGDPETGTWTEHRDEIAYDCPDGRRVLDLDAASFGNPFSAADVRVYPIRDGLRLLTARVSWGIEGDIGNASGVALIDPASGCE